MGRLLTLLRKKGGAFTPADRDDLYLWLKAGDAATLTAPEGVISQWSDKSTNAYAFTQTTEAARPLLVADVANGKPAVRFDGIDDQLASNVNTPSKLTMFITHFNPVPQGAAKRHLLMAGDNPSFIVGIDSSIWPNSNNPAIVLSALMYDTHTVRVTFDYDADTYSVHLDGLLVGSDTTARIPPTTTWVMGKYSGWTEFLKGDVVEVVAFNAALTDAEAQEVEAYLGREYGTEYAWNPTPALELVSGTDA